MYPQLSILQTHSLLRLLVYIVLQKTLPGRTYRPTIHRPLRPRTIHRDIHPILTIKPHVHAIHCVAEIEHLFLTPTAPMPFVAIIRAPRTAHRDTSHRFNKQQVDIGSTVPERGLHVNDKVFTHQLVAHGNEDVEFRGAWVGGAAAGFLGFERPACFLHSAEELVVERLVDSSTDVTGLDTDVEGSFS